MNQKPFDDFYLFVTGLTLLVKLFLICPATIGGPCRALAIDCDKPSGTTSVCESCILIEQAVREGIRYFRAYDCETDETFQSSVKDSCTLIVE